MHGELSVQIIGRVEEALQRETEKLRASLEKRANDDRKLLEQVGASGSKTRSSLEDEIKGLRAKLDELQNLLIALKKGAQTGGGASVAAELDVRATGENQYRVSRKQFSDYSYELTRIATQIPVVAYFEGDFKVFFRHF